MDLIRVHAFTRRLAVAAVLLAVTTSPGLAQDKLAADGAAGVGIGSRIRYIEPSGNWFLRLLGKKREVVGTVTAANQASVTVLPKKGTAVQIPRTSPGSVQVSRGRERRVLRGILGGIALGLVAGAVVAGAEEFGGGYCLCMSTEPSLSDQTAVRQAALGGLALGTLLGIAVKHDTWAKTTLAQIPAAGSPTAAAWQATPILDLKNQGAGLTLHLAWK